LAEERQNMMQEPDRLERLTIAPGTLLALLAGRPGQRRSGKRRFLVDLLFHENGSLLYPSAQRLYRDRVGGLVLYLLGVRTVREMERIARERRRHGTT
jgi:hypothetical protein